MSVWLTAFINTTHLGHVGKTGGLWVVTWPPPPQVILLNPKAGGMEEEADQVPQQPLVQPYGFVQKIKALGITWITCGAPHNGYVVNHNHRSLPLHSCPQILSSWVRVRSVLGSITLYLICTFPLLDSGGRGGCILGISPHTVFGTVEVQAIHTM